MFKGRNLIDRVAGDMELGIGTRLQASLWKASPDTSVFALRAYVFVKTSPHRTPRQVAWTGPPSIRAMFGGRVPVDNKIARLLTLHLAHFRYQRKVVFPTAFSGRELRQLKSLLLLMIGELEVIYDPDSTPPKASKMIPHIEAEIVAGTGHLINMEQPEFVDERLLRFLAAQ